MPEPKDYARKFVKGGSIVFVGLVVAGILGILLRMVLTRSLSVSDYGLFYLVFASISFFGIFRDLGLGPALTKFTPEFMVKRQFGNVKSMMIFTMIIQTLLSIPVTLILFFFSDQIAVAVTGTIAASIVFKVMGIWFLLGIFFNVFRFSYQGFQDPAPYAAMDIFYPLLTLSLVALLVSALGLGVGGVALAYLIGIPILVTAWLGLTWKRHPQVIYEKIKIKKPFIKKILKFSLPVFISGMEAVILGYTDTIMVGIFHGPAQVGLYQAAQPLTSVISYFPAAIGIVFLPMISEIWARRENAVLSKAVHSVLKFSTIIIVPLVFILMAFPDTVLRSVFGPGYVLAAVALQILTAAVVIGTLSTIMQSVAAGIGKPMLIAKTVGIMAGLNVILNLIFIPTYGIAGAAATTFVSQLVGLVYLLHATGNLVKFTVPTSSFLKTIAAGLLALIFMLGLKSLITVSPWWLGALVVVVPGLLLYVGLILVLGALGKSDLDLLESVMPIPKRLIRIGKRLAK